MGALGMALLVLKDLPKKTKFRGINILNNQLRREVFQCKDCENKARKERYYKTRDQTLIKNKQKYIEKKEEYIQRSKIYYEKNREKMNEKNKLYQIANKEKINAYRNQYFKDRKANDPIFKFQTHYKTRLYKALKNCKGEKLKHSFELLDCSIEKLRAWFEYIFDENMTWENQGSYWHIDHIKPCASYNLENEDELIECFNWKNLRPCEKIENVIKNDNIDDELIKKYEKKAKKFEKMFIKSLNNNKT